MPGAGPQKPTRQSPRPAREGIYLYAPKSRRTGSKARATDEEILRILEKGPVTSDEVAKEAGVAWATAPGAPAEAGRRGEAGSCEEGESQHLPAEVPAQSAPADSSWAKVKDLEEISSEPEPYFPNDGSAAEMVERERRRA